MKVLWTLCAAYLLLRQSVEIKKYEDDPYRTSSEGWVLIVDTIVLVLVALIGWQMI